MLSTALDYRATKGLSSSATDIKMELSKGFGKKMKGTGSGRINLRFFDKETKNKQKIRFCYTSKEIIEKIILFVCFGGSKYNRDENYTWWERERVLGR